MDLAKLYWKAIHKNRTVTSYDEIKRADLQEVRFFTRGVLGKEKTFHSIKRPKDIAKWDIKWRMRTQIAAESHSEVIERFWIIEQNNTAKEILIIRESEAKEYYSDYKQCRRKPLNQTRIDEL